MSTPGGRGDEMPGHEFDLRSLCRWLRGLCVLVSVHELQIIPCPWNMHTHRTNRLCPPGACDTIRTFVNISIVASFNGASESPPIAARA